MTRKKRGGAFIRSGISGCVFGKPPLKCLGEPSRHSNKYVTKLMNSSTAINEFNEGEQFRLLDPTHKYFIPPIKQCTMDTKDIRQTNLITSCPKYAAQHQPGAIIAPGDEYTTLLLSEYGGKDIHSLTLQYKDYIPFLESLVNLFEGLHILHTNNYIHSDIKPLNIVTLKESDGVFKTRLIDFGLSIKTNTIRDALEIFKSHYIYWPLESLFLHPSTTSIRHRHPLSTGFNTIVNAWYTKLEGNYSTLPEKSYWKRDIHTSFKGRRFDTNDLKIILNKLFPIGTKTYLNLSKIDIFSLGITLAEIYNSLIDHTLITNNDDPTDKIPSEGAQNEFLITNKRNPDIKNMIDIEPDPGIKNDIKTWHTDVAENITKPIYELIYKMISIDPANRPNANDAKLEFEAILPAIRTYLTEKNLGKFNLIPEGPLQLPPPVGTPEPPFTNLNTTLFQGGIRRHPVLRKTRKNKRTRHARR